MVNKTITISLYITIEQLKYITLIYITHTLGTSLVAQMVKNWLAVWETWVQFSPWVGKIPWRREWLPTPALWPGEFHGQRILAGYKKWGWKESATPGALGRPRGTGWRGRWDGGSGWGTHVNPWLFHFNVWQNPLQLKKKKSQSQLSNFLILMYNRF